MHNKLESAGPTTDHKGLFPINWTAPAKPCEACRYDHVTAELPFGNFSIEWKGWKEYDSYTTYFNGVYIGDGMGLDEAKTLAAKYYYDKLEAHGAADCIGVSPVDLRAVLVALAGNPHEIRELQVLRGLPDNPIDNLLSQFNTWAEAVYVAAEPDVAS